MVRRIAANIAKLPDLLQLSGAIGRICSSAVLHVCAAKNTSDLIRFKNQVSCYLNLGVLNP